MNKVQSYPEQNHSCSALYRRKPYPQGLSWASKPLQLASPCIFFLSLLLHTESFHSKAQRGPLEFLDFSTSAMHVNEPGEGFNLLLRWKKTCLTSFCSEVVESRPHPRGLVEHGRFASQEKALCKCPRARTPRSLLNPMSALFYQLGDWQE